MSPRRCRRPGATRCSRWWRLEDRFASLQRRFHGIDRNVVAAFHRSSTRDGSKSSGRLPRTATRRCSARREHSVTARRGARGTSGCSVASRRGAGCLSAPTGPAGSGARARRTSCATAPRSTWPTRVPLLRFTDAHVGAGPAGCSRATAAFPSRRRPTKSDTKNCPVRPAGRRPLVRELRRVRSRPDCAAVGETVRSHSSSRSGAATADIRGTSGISSSTNCAGLAA